MRCIIISNKTYRFGIIGTGVVGTALAVDLEKAGHECIGVITRSKKSYGQFFRYLPRNQLALSQLAACCDLIFITTHDSAIQQVALQLSQQRAFRKKQCWIHCSGSLRSEIMCIDSSLPIDYLSLHPLQAFASVESALSLMAGTHFGIEGSNGETEELAISLVHCLRGIPHKIDPQKKNLYHAGAVVASNYLVSLALLAVRLLEQAGIGKNEALDSLLPLIAGSYQNIAGLGLPCALTGPIARGDADVIDKHLQEMPQELGEIYKGLGRLALDLGKERKALNEGSYEPEVLALLEQLLKAK